MSFDFEEYTRAQSLEDWIMTKCEDWRNHYENNYEARHDEYYRLWRGI